MAQLRQDPVKNLDTDENLHMYGPTDRITRGQIHRLLNVHEIEHDPKGTMDYLMQLVRMHNIPLSGIPKAGLLRAVDGGILNPTGGTPTELKPRPKPLPEGYKEDGYPKSVFSLRKMCKDNGIKTNNKSTRKWCIEQLENLEAESGKDSA